MVDLKKKIDLELGGNVTSKSRQFGRQIQGFANSARRSLGSLGPVLNRASKGLDRLGNRYTGVVAGFASGATIRSLTQLEERFTRLGIQANVSEGAVTSLRDEIFRTAQTADIRIDPGQLTSAVEKIVEKTGDLKFAQENLENLGKAIQATGARGQDIGALTAELKKFGITTQDGVLEALDTLTVQGKEGAFTLQNFATQGERMVSAYAAIGRTGPDAVREIGALAQVARQGSGSSEQAATAIEAVVRTLNDLEKIKLLEGGGIKIFDEEALDRGVKQMRPVPEILKEVITTLDGQTDLIGQVFDAEAIRAVNAAIGDFKADGQFEQTFDKFIQLSGQGAEISKDSARASQTLSAALTNVATAANKFADANLTGRLQSLADTLNSIDPESFERLMTALTIGAGTLGGLVVANKAVQGIGALRRGLGSFRGGRGGKGGGPLAGGAAGVQRVFVVNQVAGRGSGGGGVVSDQVGNRRGRGRGRRRGPRLGGRATAGAALAVGAIGLGSTLFDDEATAEDIGGSVGALGGSVAGLAAGAAIGSVVPVVGTIAGAIIGGVLGYLGANVGEEIGRDVGRAIAGSAADQVGGQQQIVVRLEAEPGTRATSVTGTGAVSIEGDIGLLGGS